MYYFYYFPIGTEGRLKRVPVVTMGLIGLLLLVHYLLYYFKPTVHWFHVLVLSVDAPTLVQAFTACFVHGGLFHLVGNLLYLGTFGPALEDRVGRGAFLGFFLVAGLVSMLVQVEICRGFPPEGRPSYILGASGSIAGILGLFITRCWFLKVRVAHATFAYFQGIAKGGVTAIPAWIAIAAWSLLQGIYSLVSLDTGSGGVAYWAHISGLLLGVALGLALGMGSRSRREGLLIGARRYLDSGAWFAALGEFETYREKYGEHPEAEAGAARCLRLSGRRGQAGEAYHRAVELLAAEERWGEVVGVVEEATRMNGDLRFPPDILAGAARALLEADDIVRSADFLERAGRTDSDAARGAELLEQAAHMIRMYLGDLERAAVVYTQAADLVSAASQGRADEIERLRDQSRSCRKVFAKRLRLARQGA